MSALVCRSKQTNTEIGRQTNSYSAAEAWARANVEAEQRERILAAARALGPERFNRLIESVPEVRARGRLRYWQEELIARLGGFAEPLDSNAEEFFAAFDGAEPMPELPRVVTREEFFARPNYWYYLGGAPIPDEWIAAAWEELPEFRDNLTYEFVREASKVGDIGGLVHSLRFLDSILPLHRMVEIFERVRARAPEREPEFRPTFERVFGERMAAFPVPLSPREHEWPSYPYGVSDPGMDDDAIPF